jgi:hypothetical protein
VRLKKIGTRLAATMGAALVAVVMIAGPARADVEPTTTSLRLSSHRVVFGLESSFGMTVDSSAPTGPWEIRAGSPTFPTIVLCSGSFPGKFCLMPAGALPLGNYNLTAIYLGDENHGFSQSGFEPLTVIAQQPTSTSLELGNFQTVVFGHEQFSNINIQTVADDGRPVLGAGTILLGSTPLNPRCTSMRYNDIGQATCNLLPTELPPGTYQLAGRFDGSQNLAVSTSPPRTLTVLPQQSTTTRLTLSTPTVTFGDEQVETFTATVTPQFDGKPTGVVTVKAGTTTLCSFGLVNARGQCSLTASQLRSGSYRLTASYGGDNDTYLASEDTTQTLTVAKQPTVTDLAVSADIIASGSEQAELFSVEVFADTGVPTGNITVKAGALAVCTIILVNAAGNCSLTPQQLAVGEHQITATYNGDANHARSVSSPPQTVSVVPALNRFRHPGL